MAPLAPPGSATDYHEYNLHQPSLQKNVADSLPPANEVCEGNVFTGVCLSAGGSRSLSKGVISVPG